MKKIWEFLNGKKTVFGLVILQAAHLPFIAANPTLTLVFNLVGGILTGVGVVHKSVKPPTPIPPPAE